MIQKTQQHKPY